MHPYRYKLRLSKRIKVQIALDSREEARHLETLIILSPIPLNPGTTIRVKKHLDPSEEGYLFNPHYELIIGGTITVTACYTEPSVTQNEFSIVEIEATAIVVDPAV